MTAEGSDIHTARSGGTAEIVGLLVAVRGSPADILVAMAGGGRKAVVREGWAAARLWLGAWLITNHPAKERKTKDLAKETQKK